MKNFVVLYSLNFLYKKIFDKIDYYQEVADYEVSLKDRCAIGILSNLTIFDKERLEYAENFPP